MINIGVTGVCPCIQVCIMCAFMHVHLPACVFMCMFVCVTRIHVGMCFYVSSYESVGFGKMAND